MGTRKFRPTTPSRRAMSGNDFADLTKGAKVEKYISAQTPDVSNVYATATPDVKGLGGPVYV